MSFHFPNVQTITGEGSPPPHLHLQGALEKHEPACYVVCRDAAQAALLPAWSDWGATSAALARLFVLGHGRGGVLSLRGYDAGFAPALTPSLHDSA